MAEERAVAAALPRAALPDRLGLLHDLWRVTRSPAHLAEARARLAEWLERLPPALREGIEDRIPVFAAIREGIPLET